MKKCYLLAAAAAMLTACTNNEKLTADIDNDGQVLIGFETFHEKSTKATGEITQPNHLTKENGGFGVWGYKAADVATAAVPDGETEAIVNVSSYTTIFDNVKVWWESTNDYDSDNNSENDAVHYHFTYAIPKYWDKGSEYIFFAYAPHDAAASIEEATGKITISSIPSIQDISAFTGSASTKKYDGTTNDQKVTDYLMATYVTNQKYNASPYTNQHGKNYDDAEQTVGFTFGHMLSKLRIKLEAFSEFEGIKELIVNNLSIENMPATKTTTTNFTQNSPISPSGTYSPTAYNSELLVIKDGAGENEVATSKTGLYILAGGKGLDANDEETTTVADMVGSQAPTHNKQNFNYYVAPNNPNDNTNDDNKKYLVNLNYTINYVDGMTENVAVSDIDISDILPKLEQNYYYILTIKIQMNQILFTVDRVIDWAPRDPNTEEGVNQTVEIVKVIN